MSWSEKGVLRVQRGRLRPAAEPAGGGLHLYVRPIANGRAVGEGHRRFVGRAADNVGGNMNG